jgi:hypothetical protein
MANDLVDVIWRVSGTYEGAAQADIIHHWSTTSGNDKRGQRCTAHSLRTEITSVPVSVLFSTLPAVVAARTKMDPHDPN